MGRIKLVFGTVNTFPGGLEAERVEALYQGYLVPVLKSLYNRRKIQPTFYHSGSMIEWLQANHSEYISAFSEMLQQRRVELLGGGFWDPIFPVVPRLDRLGQLEHLTNRLRQVFNKKPRGAWISNFFWEPDMASVLYTAGMEYSFLDDTFFKRAGMESKDLYHPAITEDQGKTVVLFPVSGQCRRMFWKSSPEALIDYIISQGDDTGDRVMVLMYDCSMYSQEMSNDTELRLTWLNTFLDLLEEAQDRREIETVLPSKLLRRPVYMTRAYFESPTLEEVHAAAVGQSLPVGHYPSPEVLLPGINRLGYFAQKNVRHSLARYPEANLLYAKMQYIHSLVSQIKGDKYRKQASRESLWQAQNHGPYWHGPDGGLYRNTYRKTAYSHLIDAEKSAREKGVFAPGIISFDFDFDGVHEFLFQGNDINCYVHPKGGLVFELDYLPNPWNYADTCSRHPEMYHLSAQEAEGYDTWPRRLFVDHFLDANLGLETFMRAEHEERGSFLHDTYALSAIKRENMELVLERLGTVLTGDHPSRFETHQVQMHKTFVFGKQSVSVRWDIENVGDKPMETIFASELNLGFASDDVRDLRVFSKEGKSKATELSAEIQDHSGLQGLVFHDTSRKIALSLAWQGSLGCWSFPLTTSFKTSEGFMREYQATCIVPRWQVSLAPGQKLSFELELSFAKMPGRGVGLS